MLPKFVGIGAQRAGTTWMHMCLKSHPQVFMPEGKEAHFFDENFEKGMDWYEEMFRDAPPDALVGEFTPNYLDSPLAIGRLAEIIPDAKLLVVLREPVSRALSAYSLLHEQYRGVSFREAFDRKGQLVSMGLYAQHLKRVFTHFPREQVKIFLYEDIEQKPERLLVELFQFLDIDSTYRPPETRKRYNRILFPESQKFLAKIGMGFVVEMVKKTPVGDLVKNYFHSRARIDALHEVEIADVSHFREAFREDILELQEMLGRDLSAWLGEQPTMARR
ncbi:MAG: sulfotransferase [Planctomycetota bacterium]